MTYARSLSGLSPLEEVIAQQCRQQAKATIDPLLVKVADLSSNWSTTGFYTPDELLRGISATMDAARIARSSLDRVMAEPSDRMGDLMDASDRLFAAEQRSIDYIDAAKQAKQNGIRVVNAPGFKQWAIDTLKAGAGAMMTASFAACMNPWWLGLIASFQSGFDVAWSAVRAVGQTVLLVGEDVLKVAATLPELYGTLKWVGLAGIAGYFAWKYFKPKE